MKKFIFIVSIVMLSITIGFSQNKRANYWAFGDSLPGGTKGIGLSFNTNPPTVINDCGLYVNNCIASISDTVGNLLFYANNRVVLNANHDTMPNGNINLPDDLSSSIIIPKPGNTNLYYLITGGQVYPGQLYYSIIDMNADNGLGDVIEKNIQFYTGIDRMKLAATYHENKHDVWLISHQRYDSTFVSFLITENGIDTVPVKSYIGFNQALNIYFLGGQIKFSYSGTKLAMAVGSSTGNGRVELFNFNKETGAVYNQIFRTNYESPWGVEFSPSEDFLYIGGGRLSQYNISLSSDSLIINSRVDIGTSGYKGIQIAHDGKIYINEYLGGNEQQILKTISYPDSAGIACGFGDSPINLSDYGKLVRAGFPNFISNYFDFSTSVRTPELSKGEFEVYPNPASNRLTVIGKQLLVNSNKLILFDLFGKEVLSIELKEQTIDISQVPQGVYVYKIEDYKGVVKSGKLVVMR